MTFWHEGSMEPKRNYRFLVTIGSGTSTMQGEQWWAKTCDVPSFDTSEVEHNFYDNKYYYPGRVTWNSINMTVVDPKSVNIVYRLNQVIQDSGYNVKSNTGTATSPIKSISKQKAAAGLAGETNNLINAITITVFDAEGNQIELWTLQNPFLKSSKFGSLDYSNDELRQVDMEIRYDWCKISGRTIDGDTVSELAELH